MKKQTIYFLLIVLLLTACSRVNTSSQPSTATPKTPSFLLPMERVILHSASYTIIAKDPAKALAELQKAVEEAGGYVSSASAWSGEGSSSYASLNAKVPPEALATLGAKLEKLAVEIQNQSVYTQDVTEEVLRLQQRHAELTEAQNEILLYLISRKEVGKVSTYAVLQELLTSELQAVESQLASYEEQSKLASFDITINQKSNLVTPIE